MRTINAKVGSRTGRETYVIMRFPTEFQARQVWRAIQDVANTGDIDRRAYFVICKGHPYGIEVVLALPPDSDRPAQLDAIIMYCQKHLDLTIRVGSMPHQDYEPYAMLARAARAQDN